MTQPITWLALVAAAAAAALIAAPAAAHVVLDDPQALAGTPYKAVLRVGHGCAGSATHTITVRIPAGFANAKPMPKPGWALSIERGSGDQVQAITWKAASRDAWLADAWTDDFVLRGQPPATSGALWFKVLQQCEQGQVDWADVPASGTSVQGIKTPALLLDVRPNPHAGHAGHGSHMQ